MYSGFEHELSVRRSSMVRERNSLQSSANSDLRQNVAVAMGYLFLVCVPTHTVRCVRLLIAWQKNLLKNAFKSESFEKWRVVRFKDALFHLLQTVDLSNSAVSRKPELRAAHTSQFCACKYALSRSKR